MAEKEKKELAKIKPDTFIRYRHIFKDFLKGDSATSLMDSHNSSRTTVDAAIKYMLQYCDNDFNDDEEITLAVEKVNDRIQELRDLKTLAENAKNFNTALNCMKEIRQNEEVVYKLRGLLMLKIPDLPIAGGIVLITGLELGKGHKKKENIVDITPKNRLPEGTPNE